ncbi:5-aminolevulinate synthase [Streptomyces inhibens]|uniref:5-aminolevulinate synthase n=1 Tax=Streptomyces inhibens TaxID=2293571 RepID=UPI001EE7375B|nr:5-aminolevulinate synthase [Streptomyces inhibens]UKY54108.1 5-aminolevulinate synthase [Streptomyces inhibens]
MSQHVDFFSRELAELGNGRRDFMEVGRHAGRFPKALARGIRPGSTVSEISVWCSNDYLGMGEHPVVLEAMKRAIDEYGAGSGGSRNISGTNHCHVLLEKELATLHGKDSALLFSSGYAANDGALTVLAGRMDDCIVFSDELNHASIIDGLRHSGAEKRIFRHNDTAHLEELIAASDPDRPKLIVLESVYSMSGDIAPLAEIAEIARRHQATTFLDEVHAVGLYGPQGAGIAAREGLRDDFTVIMGTLGKGFGTAGGYLAGPAPLIDAVRNFSRPFIFTTSLPPAVAAGALAAVRYLRGSDRERERLHENARHLQRLLGKHGIPHVSDDSHIVSVLIGDDTTCKEAAARLLHQHGIYAQAINAPSVRTGEEILRIAPSAVHTHDDVEEFAAALNEVWSEIGTTAPSPPRTAAAPSNTGAPRYGAKQADGA